MPSRLRLTLAALFTISATSLFIWRMRTDPHANAAPQPATLTMKPAEAAPAKELREADAVRSTLLEQMERQSVDLTPQQREDLADHMSVILVARTVGTPDDYQSLMESWGGRSRYAQSPEELEKAKKLWRKPSDPAALELIGLAEVSIRRIGAKDPEKNEYGLSSMVAITSFDFSSTWKQIYDSSPPAALITFPAKNNAGDIQHISYRMVWAGPKHGWIPYTMNIKVKQGKPIPMLFF